jgi:hypothetical protein
MYTTQIETCAADFPICASHSLPPAASHSQPIANPVQPIVFTLFTPKNFIPTKPTSVYSAYSVVTSTPTKPVSYRTFSHLYRETKFFPLAPYFPHPTIISPPSFRRFRVFPLTLFSPREGRDRLSERSVLCAIGYPFLATYCRHTLRKPALYRICTANEVFPSSQTSLFYATRNVASWQFFPPPFPEPPRDPVPLTAHGGTRPSN